MASPAQPAAAAGRAVPASLALRAGPCSFLPPYAGVAVGATLLLAALPVLAGAWLALAVIPRREYRSGPAAGQR